MYPPATLSSPVSIPNVKQLNVQTPLVKQVYFPFKPLHKAIAIVPTLLETSISKVSLALRLGETRPNLMETIRVSFPPRWQMINDCVSTILFVPGLMRNTVLAGLELR